MSVYLSPGVYTREIDLSLYVANLGTTAVGMVGLATKGPINEPQYISDPVAFNATFGDPDPNGAYKATYAALQYLHTGRQLWFVRVAELDPAEGATEPYLAKSASTAVNTVATPATLTQTSNPGLVTITSDAHILQFEVDN